MTSTYFEGEAEANPQARRGYSRDHRPDIGGVEQFKEVAFLVRSSTDG